MGGLCCHCCYTTARNIEPESRLDGRVVIITGVTVDGIGFETAKVLAARGATTVLAGRSDKRLEAARKALQKAVPSSNLVTLKLDVSDFRSIEAFVSAFQALRLSLNILIHNAGILAPDGGKHQLAPNTPQIELTMATNYLGPYYLTKLLLPALLQSSQDQRSQHPDAPFISRVIHVASTAHGFSNIPFALSRMKSYFQPQAQYYDSWSTYCDSKLCQMFHAQELSRQYDASTQLQAFSLHPGVVYTPLGGAWWARCFCCCFMCCLKSAPMGAATTTYLALARSSDLVEQSGEYFSQETSLPEVVRLSHSFRKPEAAKMVWDMSEEFIQTWIREGEGSNTNGSEANRVNVTSGAAGKAAAVASSSSSPEEASSSSSPIVASDLATVMPAKSSTTIASSSSAVNSSAAAPHALASHEALSDDVIESERLLLHSADNAAKPSAERNSASSTHDYASEV